MSCFFTAPISLTGCTDSERLDFEEARLGGAVRGRDGRPNEADLEGEMRSPLAPRGVCSLGLLDEDPAGPELMARDNADKDSLRAAASCSSICLW